MNDFKRIYKFQITLKVLYNYYPESSEMQTEAKYLGEKTIESKLWPTFPNEIREKDPIEFYVFGKEPVKAKVLNLEHKLFIPCEHTLVILEPVKVYGKDITEARKLFDALTEKYSFLEKQGA